MKAIEALVKAKLAAKPGLEGAADLWRRLCQAYAEGGADGAGVLLERLRGGSEESTDEGSEE